MMTQMEYDSSAPDGGSNVLHINPGTNESAYQWTNFIDLTTGGSPDYFTLSGYMYTKNGLIKEVSSGGKTFTFEYNENNNLLSRTYANSTQDVYTYNKANQIVQTQTLDSSNQPKWSSKYTYDKDGRVTKVTGTGFDSPTADYYYNNGVEKLNRLTKAIIDPNDRSGAQTFNYASRND